ncbi:MAG: hypothetical protein COA79_08505 [Planctomycetota bacterium]|nr:MAG: hypothetical protein COA79_08505 [Planctomycetota bacterium]
MYLGVDCSTQSMSGMLYDSGQNKIIKEISIDFSSHFPEFTFEGDKSINECVVNPILWISALDKLFVEFKKAGVDFSKLKGIGGSAQQHATVYLNKKFKENWDWNEDLESTIKPLLSIERSPIWMDNSTEKECHEINSSLSSEDYAIENSGSVVTERFSGPQIRRFAKNFKNEYEQTSVVHLLSSFMTCLFVGHDCPMESSDASGMNLLNLNSMQWDESLVNSTDYELKDKLPELIDGNQVAGKIASYFVEKYGINPEASVVYFTGDNISSALGIGCDDSSMAVISLGTSDTLFLYNDSFQVNVRNSNTFCHTNGGYISLLCFQNGAFARDKIRSDLNYDWEQFDKCLSDSTPGNNEIVQLPFFGPEINPHLPNGKEGFNLERKFEATEIVRSLLEAQAMNMNIQSKSMSQQLKQIIVTGGGSNCDGFCQIIANVFQCKVIRKNISNTASLGGIVRAYSVIEKEIFEMDDEIKDITEPQPETESIYNKLEGHFKELLSK